MNRAEASRWLEAAWYGRSPLTALLVPLSVVYGLVVRTKRRLYLAGWRHGVELPVPVIVVGNLTAGGTGKTPVVDWLATALRDAGWHPGIVSRGYAGRSQREPCRVRPDQGADEVGDEALLLARRTGLPVCVCVDRVAAARCAIDAGADVVIADDGLQHYRLGRDIEIAVVDGERRMGNGHLLPAGPLREPLSRLAAVDWVLVNGGQAVGGEDAFQLTATRLERLDGAVRLPAGALAGRRVRMVAGIGNPHRFRRQLEALGMQVEEVPVADHGLVAPEVLHAAPVPVVMTEKDAVKYPPLPGADVWVMPVQLQAPPGLAAKIVQRVADIAARKRRSPAAMDEGPQ